MGEAAYDRIGVGYATTRRADPRIAAAIREALGDAETVLNVGAGTGNYEPTDRCVFAVEPSPVMLAQRPPGAAPAVQAVAEAVPFPDGSFDAAMAVLTVHHWADVAAGLRELRRVSRRQVLAGFDDTQADGWRWLTDYFPHIKPSWRAPFAEIARHVSIRRLVVVPIPADCTDGFGGAHWAYPEAYLDPQVRAGISAFAALSDEELRPALDRFAAALASGEWDERFGHLRTQAEHDLGYRLIVAGR